MYLFIVLYSTSNDLFRIHYWIPASTHQLGYNGSVHMALIQSIVTVGVRIRPTCPYAQRYRHSDSVLAQTGLLLMCFSGHSLLEVDVENAGHGLVSLTHHSRTSTILSLAQLMSCWNNGTHLRFTRDPAWQVTASEEQLLDLERSVAMLYVQSHFDVFGRAACLPRRL